MLPIDELRRLPNVRRAWPGRGSTLIFEQWDDQGRLRAGRITADGTVCLLDHCQDPALPDLAPTQGARLLVHRWGRRAVMDHGDSVVKHLRSGKGSGAARRMWIAEALCDQVGLGYPVVLDVTEHHLEMTRLAGRPVRECGDEGLGAWRQLVERWPELTRQPMSLPTHTAHDEAAVVWDWYVRARRFRVIPDDPRQEDLIRRVCQRLSSDQSVLVVTHRDLHEGQLLWDGNRLGVIDWDTVCLAAPALDLTNLWAHVELCCVQDHWSYALGDHVLGLLDDLAARLGVTRNGFDSYLDAARLRLWLVHAFRPTSAYWLDDWLSHCLRGSADRNASIDRR